MIGQICNQDQSSYFLVQNPFFRTHIIYSSPRAKRAVGRDDFNLTFMIFFGELPYDVGYQKKHVRPHGEGWGLLLYLAQPSPSWLNFFTRQNVFFLFFQKALPA